MVADFWFSVSFSFELSVFARPLNVIENIKLFMLLAK